MISESTKVSTFPITTSVESWHTHRIGGICDIYNGATPSTADYSNWDGEVIWLTPTDLSNKAGKYILKGERNITQTGYESSAASLAPEGSIAISTRAPIGHIAILMESACVNQGCRLLVPNESLVSEFLYYFLIVNIDNLQSLGQGSTFVELSSHDLSNVKIQMPSLEEQKEIVKYLDYADQIVRGGVSQKQELVELMEEYKRAVIQQAVTRRLDPDVPLKPSGVEWLGDIPEHWDVRRLKSVCRFSYGDSLSSEDRIEGSIPVFGSNGQVDFHINANTNGPCIVIGRKGSFGKVHYSEKPVFAIDTTFFIDSRFTDANLRYLSYLLGILSLDSVSRDSAVPGLSREDAYQHMVAIPSFTEQVAIVAHLDKLTSDIDAAIAHTRREIELLEEYRTRLIADVVTGKLDVREAAANLPDVNLDDLQPAAEGGGADD